MTSRASVSLTEIDSSDCSARSTCDGFSVIYTAQIGFEEKIIRPHSVPLNASCPVRAVEETDALRVVKSLMLPLERGRAQSLSTAISFYSKVSEDK